MPSNIVQGASTYTAERVLQILQDETYVFSPERRGVPVEFGVLKWAFETTESGTLITHTSTTRAQRATKYCQEHLDNIRNSIAASKVLARLDEHHSRLLQCSFRPEKQEAVIVERVCQLLSRLPATPVELGDGSPEQCSGLSADHFLPEPEPISRSWDNLQATNFVSTNTIRLAIQMECAGNTYWAHAFGSYINMLAELLDTALSFPSTAESLVLKTFLWTSWQRAVMLQFSYLMSGHLRVGYDFSRNEALSLDMPRALQKAFQGENSTLRDLPPYLCRWAFESIRSDRAAVMLDFRDFLERYASLFGSRTSRCVLTSDGEIQNWKPCSGESPGACNRFIGKKIEDQSAHATDCLGGCPRLFWNEESYKRCLGARAVSLEDGNTSLHYCTASSNTMAISHVWSHGQGGRPEHPSPLQSTSSHRFHRHRNKLICGTGLNQCLHQRYKQISRNFGCDSYWMDTPCIPQDHQLRNEAINNINSVFANSKCTLVCDMDLMQVNVAELTLELMESILAALLVCDWNVRAWTLLEAMRGRHNIQILCKNEQVIPLKDLLEEVHQRGSLSLAGLFATAQHLLPAQQPPPGSTPHQYLDERAKGFVNVEEAACLLSHRHASRPGDEVIIWSLLCGPIVRHSAIEFWRQRVDHVVLTGFLVSSCPRVHAPLSITRSGFGWAPCRPNMPAIRKLPLSKTYFGDDGARTAGGLINARGLKSAWLVAHIKGGLPSLSMSKADPLSSTVLISIESERLLHEIAFRFLRRYTWGAILQATEEAMTGRPVWYRGNADGFLLVVVGSYNREKWHWKGVYEWDHSVPLPVFAREVVWLV